MIGTLILLFVYILATIGAMKLLWFSGPAKVAAWQIVIPIGALLVLGYTIYRNIWPYPAMHGDDGSTTRSSSCRSCAGSGSHWRSCWSWRSGPAWRVAPARS